MDRLLSRINTIGPPHSTGGACIFRCFVCVPLHCCSDWTLTSLGSDWERHSSCDAPACWIPGARDDMDDLSPRDKELFLEPHRVFRFDEDPIPEFTFLSPFLSSGSPPSGLLPQLPASEPPSPLDAVYSVPQALHPPDNPNSPVVPSSADSDLGSPVSSALSTTVAGSPTMHLPLLSLTTDSSPMSASSPNGVLTKVKKWVRKVWQRLKTRSSGT